MIRGKHFEKRRNPVSGIQYKQYLEEAHSCETTENKLTTKTYFFNVIFDDGTSPEMLVVLAACDLIFLWVFVHLYAFRHIILSDLSRLSVTLSTAQSRRCSS